MTELDRVASRWQQLEPAVQTRVVAVEVLGELPEHGTEPAGVAHRLQWLVEACYGIADVE